MYVIIDQYYGVIREVLGPFSSSAAAVKYVEEDQNLKIGDVVIKEVTTAAQRGEEK